MSNICNSCERSFETWIASTEHRYHYTESGLDNIWLEGVTVYSCPNCEVESADIPDLEGLHKLIAKDLILTPLPMTGVELRFLRKENKFKLKDFAERMGVDPKTINNLEKSVQLNKQTDVTVRVLVIGALWQGEEQIKALIEFADIAKYSWEESAPETEQQIEENAAESTIFGLSEQREWKIAA
jgi:transcriptional regulator with XRE-family HTH domain